MNKKNIILHIGPHKTASTYIQNQIYKNENILNKYNIIYPKVGFFGYGHHELAQLFLDKKYKQIEILIKKILNSENDNIILSSEDFDKLDIEDVKKICYFFRYHNIKIVYVKRFTCEIMVSHWQEMIKHGNTYSWSEYFFENINNPMNSRVINSCYVLDLYTNVFGKENIYIIDYNQAKRDNENIFKLFIELISKINDFEYNDEKIINKSLDYLDVEIIRMLNYTHNGLVDLKCLNCAIDTSIYKAYMIILTKDTQAIIKNIDFIKERIKKNMHQVDFKNSFIFNYLDDMFFDKYNSCVVNFRGDNSSYNKNLTFKLPLNNWIINEGVFEALNELYEEVLKHIEK